MGSSAETAPTAAATEPGGQAAIEVHDLSVAYPTRDGTVTALADVDFTARRGEFVSVVGPSGCGKSTLLFAISGLRPASQGSISILGEPGGTSISRDVGLVFQRDALLPWRTAQQNVALGLRYRGVPKREAARTASDWLGRVGLRGFENSFPHQLSGGMRKRVSIAASMVFQPRILLMDEPFSALDAQTRNLMENDLLRIWEETKQTVVFITHDLEEAIGLSDRIVTMTAAPGRVLGERVVSLPRPRDLIEIRFDPGFAALHEQLWGDLREQVMRAGLMPEG